MIEKKKDHSKQYFKMILDLNVDVNYSFYLIQYIKKQIKKVKNDRNYKGKDQLQDKESGNEII